MPDVATYAIRKPVAFVSVAVAIVILCLNAALVVQNRALKEKLTKPAPSLLPPVGNLMAPLEGLDSSGSSIVISYNTPKIKNSAVHILAGLNEHFQNTGLKTL